MASLQVPNVQELVRTNPLRIPDKFILKNVDEQDKQKSTSHNFSSDDIPIIDHSLLLSGHQEELTKLDLACKEWGFFQLVNHGVASEVLQGMKDGSAKFFELPLEEKDKIALSKAKGRLDGYGQPFVASEEQTLDWSDALVLSVYPPQRKNPEFWPTTPKGYKESIEAYCSEVKRVGEELLGSLSSILGLEKDDLLGLHQEVVQELRVNYYPPCPMPDRVNGTSPHSDTPTIAILMQEDNVTGLHIRKEGQWVPVKPIPNVFVVNVGDMLEIWSNGRYKSIEHKGVPNKSRVRISYASFLGPRNDAEVAPLEHLLESDGSGKLYKKIKYGEYREKALLKAKLNGKLQIDQMAKIAST